MSKQVIVMRKFQNLRTGKYIAQGAHASTSVVIQLFNKKLKGEEFSPAVDEWINGIFKKICVYVETEDEVVDIYNKAKEAGIVCSLITDSGLTEFGGVPTVTCCAIGPDTDEKVNEITGGLKLL